MTRARIDSFAEKVGSGATPRGGSATYQAKRTRYALIRSQNVFDRQFTQEGLAYISDGQAAELRGAEVREGDVLLNITGDGVTFGRSCLAPKAVLPACVNQHVVIIRVDPNVCDPGYLLGFLTLPSTKRYMENFNTGGSRRALTKGHIESFELDLPPIEEQRRIAGILSAYDDLIENCQRRIKILEEMARSLYREWFVHFRYPGHESVPLVPSPLGPIPREWKAKALQDVIDSHIGGGWGKDQPEAGYELPAWVIRGTDIPATRLLDVSSIPFRYHAASNLKSRRLNTGDIVFEVSGGSKGQLVGRSMLFSDQHSAALGEHPVICASFCKRVTPSGGVSPEWLWLSFLEAYENGELEQYQVQSTGISNFKWTDYITQTGRPVPPDSVRDKFDSLAKPILAEVNLLGQQAANLRRTRDLLLPKLIGGESA